MGEGAPVDVATVLCQWAAGGLAYLWVTTRRREVGLGYGWLLRSIYMTIAVAGAVTGLAFQSNWVRDAACIAMGVAAAAALVRSTLRSRAATSADGPGPASDMRGVRSVDGLDPRWDLPAPLLGMVGVVAAALASPGEVAAVLHLARLGVGAAFLGVVTDAMLLGHWYLVQPGLRREPLRELIRHLASIWPIEVGLLLIPTGMLSVFSGSIDDGYAGLLGWFWAACAITTIALAGVAFAALREREYAAVMAATGLLYLAILTGFGTDLVARLTLVS